MRYAESIEFLYGLRMFGAKFGLDNTHSLAALAENPQDKLRFIHVAGTNGKGSTCAMLESVYRHAGLRVGLFTSPHLVSFRERIQVNRDLISEADVVRLVEEMQPWLAQFPRDRHPTFFEVITVIALLYFAEQKCELVIWETGLGGRLDATNIVTPLASVITNIAFDHQQWLGDTLEKIAAEKAGIIKPGVPVLTATDSPEALAVIKTKARELSAPLTIVAAPRESAADLSAATVRLLGSHQRTNAALALATVRALHEKIPVSEPAMRTGLEQVQWHGRFQIVKLAGDRTLLLDGAHNPAGATALATALQQNFPAQSPSLVLGMLADKDCAAFCQRLAPLARHIHLVPVSSERSARPADLQLLCRAANSDTSVTIHASLSAALNAVASEPFVVLTGSLYLVGEALEQLGLSPAHGREERGLNEWTASKP